MKRSKPTRDKGAALVIDSKASIKATTEEFPPLRETKHQFIGVWSSTPKAEKPR
jgi:hypothetical protein